MSLSFFYISNVLDKTTTINITNSRHNLSFIPGDVLYCTADGNPSPQYEWIDLVNGGKMPGANLSVTKSMVGKEQVWLCLANNTVAGSNKPIGRNVTFVVNQAGERTVCI